MSFSVVFAIIMQKLISEYCDLAENPPSNITV